MFEGETIIQGIIYLREMIKKNDRKINNNVVDTYNLLIKTNKRLDLIEQEIEKLKEVKQ